MRCLVILFCLVNISCATLNNTATIKETEKGVVFKTNQSVSMSMEKDGKKYTYDSKAESLMSKIVSILTLGAIGVK